MSKVIGSIAQGIGLVRDVGSVSVSLMCDQGDLFQNYSGDPATTPDVYPDYSVAAQQRTVRTMVFSPKTGGVVAKTGYEVLGWYVGDTALVFNSAGLCTGLASGATTYAGCFKKVDADGGSEKEDLLICGNLVGQTGGAGFTLKALVKVIDAVNGDTKHWAHIPFMMRSVRGDDITMEIYPVSGSTNIRNLNDTVKLGVRAYLGLTPLNIAQTVDGPEAGATVINLGTNIAISHGSNRKYGIKWEILSGGSFKTVNAVCTPYATKWYYHDTLTVAAKDIQSQLTVRAQLYCVSCLASQADATGMHAWLAQDMITVNDDTDPCAIVLSGNPPDFMIRERDNAPCAITPALYQGDSLVSYGTGGATQMVFHYTVTLTNTSGTTIRTGTVYPAGHPSATAANKSFPVTLNDLVDNNDAVVVTFEAVAD